MEAPRLPCIDPYISLSYPLACEPRSSFTACSILIWAKFRGRGCFRSNESEYIQTIDSIAGKHSPLRLTRQNLDEGIQQMRTDHGPPCQDVSQVPPNWCSGPRAEPTATSGAAPSKIASVCWNAWGALIGTSKSLIQEMHEPPSFHVPPAPPLAAPPVAAPDAPPFDPFPFPFPFPLDPFLLLSLPAGKASNPIRLHTCRYLDSVSR